MTAEDAITILLAERAPDKTICPSEAARLVAGPTEEWRHRMGDVHAAADAMAAHGKVSLTRGGEPGTSIGGAYRIGRA